jgi:uncharacterized membrane protein
MADNTPRTETQPAGDDLREYVEAFKASSDRARYALYAVVIATVLVAIINYNFQPWSWPIRRIEAWYGDAPAFQKQPANSAMTSEERIKRIADAFFGGDVDRLKTAREEYLKQFAARSVFNASPIPGVSIDCNDLGILGGIALVLLMIVLVISIMREHENLYLALYKVRRLCSIQGEDHARGDSKANLLYHALVMSQALSSPPTLARWRHRGILHHFGFVFFLPVIAYGWVLGTNRQTAKIGEAYGADMDRILAVQIVLATFLLILGCMAFLHSRAMAKRWERAFFRVNPSRRHVRQTTLWEWLRLPFPGEDDEDRRVIVELGDTLRGPDTSTIGTVPVEVNGFVADMTDPVQVDMKAMSKRLREAGDASAGEWCKIDHRGVFRKLLYFTATENVIKGKVWRVRGTWTFGYTPAPQSESQSPDGSNRTQ